MQVFELKISWIEIIEWIKSESTEATIKQFYYQKQRYEQQN